MVSVAEILEQVKALSVAERKELAKQVIDLLDAPQTVTPAENGEHWGQNLVRLLDEIGPIELVHPEIEDPVEWVKTVRREARERRLGELANWGEALDREGDPE
jgi:hypothetical protein